MITANTIPSVVNFEVLDAGHETAPRVPEASTLMAELRKAVIHLLRKPRLCMRKRLS